MNSQFEQWRVQAYTANVYQLSQQRESRLATKVRNEVFKGKTEYFDRMGLAVAQDLNGRNQPTPNLDLPLSRRMVTTRAKVWSTMVDRKDKLLQIHDPENQFAQAASMALGRAKDQVLINAALGSASAGEDGSSSVSLPNTQKICAVSGGAIAPLGVDTLRRTMQILDQNEAVGKRYFVYNAAQKQALLAHTETTSSDYNTVKALVNGEINTFMGFEFIRLELLLNSSVYSSGFTCDPVTGLYSTASDALSLGGTEKSAFAFVGDGLLMGMNEEAIGRIDEIPEYNYGIQVYNRIDVGAVRMEEAKVVEVITA